jgi:hypothetical protein
VPVAVSASIDAKGKRTQMTYTVQMAVYAHDSDSLRLVFTRGIEVFLALHLPLGVHFLHFLRRMAKVKVMQDALKE